MSGYRFTADSIDDFDKILYHLAEEAGWGISTELEARIFESLATLASDPGIGHTRADLTRQYVHFYTVEPYLIVYERDTRPIVIHAILHGARDVKRILRNRSRRA
jgi:plasmid stabilization system protein ParE